MLQVTLSSLVGELSTAAQQAGLPQDLVDRIPQYVSAGNIGLQHSDCLTIHESACSWHQYFPVLSFLVSGHLHSEYERLSGLLGLPPCSNTQWSRIVKRLEGFVTNLAEWSCSQVQKEIIERGDDKEWSASFDGFYLTRGHYSNNSSATLHDHFTGRVAWFVHRTKRGPGHNWNGTSGGAEADMLDEVLGKAKEAGFVIKEIICDKDSSTNATFCRHFPEGMVTYCSNHSAKNLHRNLEKVKRYKCEVRILKFVNFFYRLQIHDSASLTTSVVRGCQTVS